MERKTLSAGYALFLGTSLLCALSLLCMALLALSRSRLNALEKQSGLFYAELQERNEILLSEWGNAYETD